MEQETDVIDLALAPAPSPWRTHTIVLGVLTTAFVVFAIGVWPKGGTLQGNLGQVVVMLYGLALVMFALFTTALIAIFQRSRAPIATSYAITIGVVGVLMIAFLGRP